MSTAQYVPYQAYKSKRHSRVISAASVEANGLAASQARQTSSPSPDLFARSNSETKLASSDGYATPQGPSSPTRGTGSSSPNGFVIKPRPLSVLETIPTQAPTSSEAKYIKEDTAAASSNGAPGLLTSEEKSLPVPVPEVVVNEEPSDPLSSSPSSVPSTPPKPSATISAALSISPSGSSSGSSEAGPSSSSSNRPDATSRKSSTFRVIRPPTSSGGSGSTPRLSSPLRPASTLGHGRMLSAAHIPSSPSPLSSHRHFDAEVPRPGAISFPDSSQQRLPSSLGKESTVPLSSSGFHQRSSSLAVNSPAPHIVPPHRTTSLTQSSSPNPSPEAAPAPPPKPTTPSPDQPISSTSRVVSPAPQPAPSTSGSTAASTSASGTSTPVGPSAPKYRSAYRPGFQPRGFYRPRTDEFLELRSNVRNEGRIELTRLERRFEKLVELHFASSPSDEQGESKGKEKSAPPHPIRRASSLFEIDFNDLRTKSASELWRGVLESRAAAANGGKGDIRAAEQRITPWQDDSEVTACPLCTVSFHPLTNRKHHCRLCGRIICSLPVKKPLRPVPCSLLFVADPKSGRIEEVKESVDYGVRPRARADSVSGGKGKAGEAEEKFLKGVRICRECKPIMLRQQYRQEARRVPAMIRLYEALIALESEIEEELPQFQELMLQLSNNVDEAPAKEATTARKNLLQAFADYDAIAKRIRKIPCPGGQGSSQDRVQAAILARATNFLQKNMFPLQSLPKPKKRTTSTSDINGTEPGMADSQVIDPDSELAMALQPLLEQEALLESFIEEAKAHRKFEDVKTLKVNLNEIRAEIDRIVVNADSGTTKRVK